MSDYTYTGWFDGWQNARQRRAIEGLESEVGSLTSSLSRQRRESANLRSQLSQLQGTLEQRVDRLTRSLQALVELSDVRLVLAMFDPPALVRHWAQVAITALLDTGKPVDAPPAPAEDVPGYWLGPAVGALVALVRGEDASEPLATAQQRDRDRTALLLTCGLVLAGRAELADRWAADALGPLSPGVPVTVAQRTLWTVMAAGRLGESGTAVLRRRLAELVGALTPEQEQAERGAWADLATKLPSAAVRPPQVARDDPAAREILGAGVRLAALRRLCCPEPTTTDQAPGSEPSYLDEEREKELTEVLHALVDEGTREEAPLLRRAVELRAAIEDGAQAPARPGWDGDAGDPCELLRRDALDAARPAQAALARQAGRAWLLDAAVRLAEATAAGGPAQVTIAVAGSEVRVGPTGPDPWDLSQARTRSQERPVVDPRADKVTMAVAIAGGVLCLPVIGWPNSLAVLSVLAGIGLLVTAGLRWSRERAARAERGARREAEQAHLERHAEQAATQLADLHRQLAEAAEQGTADLAAIRAGLG